MRAFFAGLIDKKKDQKSSFSTKNLWITRKFAKKISFKRKNVQKNLAVLEIVIILA